MDYVYEKGLADLTGFEVSGFNIRQVIIDLHPFFAEGKEEWRNNGEVAFIRLSVLSEGDVIVVGFVNPYSVGYFSIGLDIFQIGSESVIACGAGNMDVGFIEMHFFPIGIVCFTLKNGFVCTGRGDIHGEGLGCRLIKIEDSIACKACDDRVTADVEHGVFQAIEEQVASFQCDNGTRATSLEGTMAFEMHIQVVLLATVKMDHGVGVVSA